MAKGTGAAKKGKGAEPRIDASLLHPSVSAEYRRIVEAEARNGTTSWEAAFASYPWVALAVGTLLSSLLLNRHQPLADKLVRGIVGLALAAGLQTATRVAFDRWRRRRITHAVRDPAEMERVLTLIARGQHGKPVKEYTKRYIGVVLNLLDGSLDAHTARGVMAEANELLDDAEALDQYGRNLRRAQDGRTIPHQGAEVLQLARRVTLASDPITKDALSRSLELARETLRATEELALALERVEAQQEAVLHAFTGLRSTLGRLQITTNSLKAPDLSPVREATAGVRGQTRAVEAAVREVAALRTGG